MKDNRIVRPGQIKENHKEDFKSAVDSFYKKHYRFKTDEERDQERRSNPNLIYKGGKWFDKRYMKGGDEFEH